MSEMKTEKDILIEIHNRFLDMRVKEDFDERLYAETPEEEKKAEERMNAAAKELENFQMMQKMNQSIPIQKVKSKEAEVVMLTKQFRSFRAPRLIALALKMMEEKK